MKNVFTTIAFLVIATLMMLPVFGQLSGAWKLTGIMKDGSAVLVINTSREVSIKFDNGNVTGNGGCNSYFGPYQANDSKIKVGPVRSTRMACTREGVSAQESLYFNILQKATKYTLVSDTLTLMNGSNRLTFKPALAPPDHTDKLEDQTASDKKIWIVDKAMVNCGGRTPRQCYQVKTSDIADWEIIQEDIEGFQYVPGKYNLIWVQQVTEGNPDTDHHRTYFKLLKVVSRTKLMPHVD
jgi:heat shock protein HslJ